MSLLPNAVLVIRDSVDAYIAISVVNFPVLPVGSSVDIHLEKSKCLEGAKIIDYEASNKYGVSVRIDICADSKAQLQEYWQDIANICVKDTGLLCDLIYSRVVDFGVRYRLPHERQYPK